MTIEGERKELIFVECLLSGPLLARGFGENEVKTSSLSGSSSTSTRLGELTSIPSCSLIWETPTVTCRMALPAVCLALTYMTTLL